MHLHTDLQTLAFQSEHVAARRLARREGIDTAQALQLVLEQKAGAAGLASLLSQRRAGQQRERDLAAQRLARQAQARLEREVRLHGPDTAWRGWFDGSATPNPGRCGIGAVLTGPHGAQVEISRAAGHGNSSEAEYLALIALLEAAQQAGAAGVTVFGDSQVVIDDAAGKRAPAPALQAHRLRAQALMAQLPGLTLHWIPRHRNGRADALSQAGARPLD